jgi:hypothetical protein
MRTLTTALAAGLLAGCAALSGNVDDGGRTYREAQNAPIDANLEPLAAEPSIPLFSDRIPTRSSFGGGSRGGGEPESACLSERWQQLIGMTEAEAREQRLPSDARVIGWGALYTQDYEPARMNVHLDQNGRVYRVICG